MPDSALIGMYGAPSERREPVTLTRLSARSMMDALIHDARLFGSTHMVNLASMALLFGLNYFHRL